MLLEVVLRVCGGFLRVSGCVKARGKRFLPFLSYTGNKANAWHSADPAPALALAPS